MTIAMNAFKEKIRRKELYIVCIIGILIVILFGTGNGEITIGGKPITGYEMLSPVILIVVNAVACILTAIMSASTIPNEYQRHTDHLIRIRKVSQARYHFELAMANFFAGLSSLGILFLSVVIFVFSQGHAGDIWKLVPAFLMMAINMAIVSFLSSTLSIILPPFLSGSISVVITLVGIFYSLLLLVKDVLGGFAGGFLKVVLFLFPNLHEISRSAGEFMGGEMADLHIILKGLLWVYIFAVLILIIKRKEA